MRRMKRSESKRHWLLVPLIALVVSTAAWIPNPTVGPVSAATITTPGPIAIGDTVTGSASAAAEVDSYPLFVATPGAMVLLDANDNSCGCQWSLAGPTGDVFDQTMSSGAPKWLAAGAHMLRITSTAAGTYGFDVVAAPAVQSFTAPLATTVSPGAPGPGAGTIESAGAQDSYTFNVPLAAQIVMRVLASSCDCTWSLRKPNGPPVFGFQSMSDTRVGLAPGMYKLRVRGAPGTYSFIARAAPAPQSFSIALGDGISNGVPATGAGNLEMGGAIDAYSFTATGGTRVRVSGSACDSSPSYTLSAPSGRRLVRDLVCGGADVLTLPTETGTYHVRVEAGTTNTGAYSLLVATTSDPPTVILPAAGVYSLTPGATVANGAPAPGAGNIEAAGAHDVYEVDGVAGSTLVLADTTGSGCSGLLWTAYPPDGPAIVSDRPFGCGTRAFRLDQSGRYEIDVRGSGTATGTYSFVLRVAPAPQSFTIATAATVKNGTPANGGGKIEAAGTIDVYNFPATRGSKVAVTDATTGGCVPIDAVVLAPDSTPSDSVQLGCGGSTAVRVDESGTYSVVVTGRGATTGTYSFRLTASPNVATGLTVAKAEGAAKITWTPPATSGGSAVTHSQIAVFNVNGGKPSGVAGALARTVASTARSYRFTGLTNGVVYRFVVREGNATGLGRDSVQSAPVKPTVNSRPNILFILTDDQRYDSVAQLPKLNARTDWLRFQKSFAEEPQCCPSRATIFTGRYSHHTNVQTLLEGRNLDDTRTIATTLDSVGYHTGFLGKYLNGYPFGVDLEPPPGWDNFESYGHSAAYYDYYVYRNGTRVDYGSAPADYSTDVWTNRASKFLNSADPAKPFFLEVAYNSPHFSTTGTAIPAPRDVGTCANQSFPLPASFNAHDFNSEPPWLAAIPNRSAGGMQYQRRQTCEALRSVDDGVSSLLAQLTSLGRLSNTYVVLMSDNGYAFGEHRLTGKGDLYEASIRVPLMVRGPGVVPGTTNRLTSNVDLVPTFLSWAKTSAPPGFVDGVSWAANAHGTAGATNPTSVLLRGCRTSLTDHPGFCGGDPGPSMGMNWGIRTASYKLVEYPSGYKQLFDLVDDPHELHNLAADPSKSGVIANLHAQLVTRRGF